MQVAREGDEDGLDVVPFQEAGPILDGIGAAAPGPLDDPLGTEPVLRFDVRDRPDLHVRRFQGRAEQGRPAIPGADEPQADRRRIGRFGHLTLGDRQSGGRIVARDPGPPHGRTGGEVFDSLRAASDPRIAAEIEATLAPLRSILPEGSLPTTLPFGPPA